MFSGVYEQSYIAHAISFAACIGPESFAKNPECKNLATSPTLSLIVFLIAQFIVNSPFHLFRE